MAAVIQSPSKLPYSATPPRAAVVDPFAVAKPAPPAARKGGVQFHDMDSREMASADGKDGGDSSIVDSAGSAGPRDPSPRKKSAKDVSVVCAYVRALSTCVSRIRHVARMML